MAQKGVRTVIDADQKLAHELSDCLWSIIVLSQLYNIDLESAFRNKEEVNKNRIWS
jgi:NTP pyrophosphatase (non-canonical NTP hydrolase)